VHGIARGSNIDDRTGVLNHRRRAGGRERSRRRPWVAHQPAVPGGADRWERLTGGARTGR